MQERLKKLIKEANSGKTSRDMDYRYENLISFGNDILTREISLTDNEILKYLNEYKNYDWDTEYYGGYNNGTSEELYTLGMNIIEKYNLYRYIEIYHDIFYGYAYDNPNKKIKDEYEEFLKIYHAWIKAGSPEGKYVRWRNVKGR